MKDQDSIFSTKDMYLMSHSANGHPFWHDRLSPTKRRKCFYNNMHLMDGIRFSSTSIPVMDPITDIPDISLVAYTDRKRVCGINEAVHFFLDDYKFRDGIWNRLEQATFELQKFDYLITPDYSFWINVPDFYNFESLFKTRFIGAYWQKCGYSVIPSASWGNLNSFRYCFEGLPSNSVIAVSGMGNQKNGDAYSRWCYGLRILEEMKSPTLIIIYGDMIDIPDIHTPIKFFPGFITKKLRKCI